MKNKEKISAILLIIFLSIALMLSYFNKLKTDESIKLNKIRTIGKITKFNGNRSFNHYYYYFYFEGKKYETNENIYYGRREECIGKYYYVEISSKNPVYSKIDLSLEITDTLLIINSGFINE